MEVDDYLRERWPPTEEAASAWDAYTDDLYVGIALGVLDVLAYGHLAETCREAARSIRKAIAQSEGAAP